MAPELKQAIEEYLEANKVVLFMKGTKQFPQCGFSNTCVQVCAHRASPLNAPAATFQPHPPGHRELKTCVCSQILNTMSVPFETVNVLEDESLRAGMKEFSQWPTFPQVRPMQLTQHWPASQHLPFGADKGCMICSCT